jgi:hypothetical protein
MRQCLKIILCLLVALACSGSTPRAQTTAKLAEPEKTHALTPAQAAELVGGPTLITLHLKEVEPKIFFEQLWAQAKLPPMSGYHSVMRSPQPLISIDCDNQPFWSVVREVAQKSQISVDEIGRSSADIQLTPAPGARGLDGEAIFAGPFLMTVSTIERKQRRRVRVSAEPEQTSAEDQLQVGFNLFSDPKLPLAADSTTVAIEQATDDKGRSLLSGQPTTGQPMVFRAGGNAKFALYARLLFEPPAENGGRLATLKGVARGFLITRTETWEIADIAQAEGQSHGALPEPLGAENVISGEDVRAAMGARAAVARYVVKQVAPTEKGYALELSFVRSRTPLENRALSAVIFDDLRFVDDKGIELGVKKSGGRGAFGVSDARREVLQDYTRRIQVIRGSQNSASGPVKMIWKIPTEFQEVEIPFEFSDLPLP